MAEKLDRGNNSHIINSDIVESIEYLNNSLNHLIKENNKESDLFDFIINNLPYGILVIDRYTRVKKINTSLINLFHLNKKEIPGVKTSSIFNNNNLEILISRTFNESGIHNEKIIFYGDEETELEIEIIPIMSDDNLKLNVNKKEELNLLILFKNVTPEIEFSKLRSQFAANISHEMKTPLTAIKGFLETLVEDDFNDHEIIKKYVNKSIDEVEHLYNLIEDVLNLSHIEYKRNIMFPRKYNLVDIINDCISSLDLLAENNDVEITFFHNSDHINYKTDRELFEKLVKNIIENTIFHAGKKARLKILINESRESIKMEFTDNGIGIEKMDLPYIFQRFYRGKNPYSLKNIGSGLGLSIVKHIVELHNGQIVATSIPNIKTQFIITLPKNNN
jgi:two-component system phosphate regulon sensor histidine kinase PhoR